MPYLQQGGIIGYQHESRVAQHMLDAPNGLLFHSTSGVIHHPKASLSSMTLERNWRLHYLWR